MKALTEPYQVPTYDLFGNDRLQTRQRFVVEECDAGRHRDHYLGYEHSTQTFRRSDIGRELMVLRDSSPAWTCWYWLDERGRLGITAEQRHNLYTHARYLFSERLPVNFDMRQFSDETSETDCGAVGCAVGHGPYAGLPKYSAESWLEYAARVFGLDVYKKEREAAWDWCFHGSWQQRDNSPRGAAQRILYLLHHGLPVDADLQRLGTAPLCYTEERP